MDSATPLSRYLFNRQSEGLDLTLPEHRGELRARVEPMLNKMPRSTLRDAMWHEMLRLCGNRREWQNNRGAGGGAGFIRGGDRKGGPPEAPVDVRVSKDSLLCVALLEAPEMASELQALCREDRQLHQARTFAEWILSRELRDKKQLMGALAFDSEARARFFRLFDGIEHLPSREHAMASTREMLTPNREAAHKQRLAALLTRKRSISDLTEAERRELQELSRQNQE